LAQSPPPAIAQTDSLDEIIVTARKVPEDVQQVPISVQVLSGEFLQSEAVSDLYQLQFNVPGLVMTNLGLFGAALSLRGVSDQGGTGQAVAAHLDGVYLGNPNLAIARTFDLERIEVLKGPQGTLYGRNSTGGSINFITKAPDDERGAELEAAYGTFSTARVLGHVNLPFGKAAFRLAFIGSTGDGYIRNSLDGRRFASNDFWGLRGSLRVNVSDRLRVDVMAQHVEDTGASGELWVPPPKFLANPSDIRLATVPLANPYLHTYTDNGSVTVGYDLGFATLRSITGYAFNEVQDLDDCSGQFPRGCVRGISPARYRQWSEEIQLASRDGAAVKWLVGGNYFDATGWSHYYQNTINSPVPTFDTFSNTEEKASALFGQATLQLARRWSVTGGLRLSHETPSVSDVGTGTRDNPTLTTATHSWNGTSWLFDVDYAIVPDLFAYASVATGYKSGGVTTTRLPSGEFDTFEPENLTAYEVGVKSQWLNRRMTLNVAAFRYDFNNMQITSVYVTNSGALSVVDNAAKAELYGMDAAGVFHLTDRLTLSAGAVWMPKRQFVDFQSSSTGEDLSGNDLSRAPEWTASSAIDYRMPLRGTGDLSARVEYNYRRSFFFSKENNPLLAQASFGLLNVFLRFEPPGRKWYA
jgi:iron complex outermembrane receptor protein